MKICYLLLLHHKFDQALRMTRRLAGPDHGFVVHIDAAAHPPSVIDFRRRMDAFAPVYATRVRARWGSYSQALAIMRCVEAAARHMASFDRYVLLSGQDYPIARQTEIAEFFSRDPDTEYLEAFPRNLTEVDVSRWTPYLRFRCHHLWFGRRRMRVPLLRKGPPPLQLYHGSTWWALTRAALLYVADQFASNRRLRRYLRTGFLVDEVYIPTLIMSSEFAPQVAGNNVTYARWTPTSGPHPTTLRIDDLPQLLASPKLFARKFDATVDESVMSELDRLHAD